MPTKPPFEHVIDGCFADSIGSGGLARAPFEALLAETAPGLAALRVSDLPLLKLPARRDDLPAIRAAAARLNGLDDVVLLGTGGSSLGGQTLYALADPAAKPRIHFHDNVDPHTFDRLLRALDPVRTGVIAISKSGTTAETLAQLIILLKWAGTGARFVAVTEPKDSPFTRLARAHGMTLLDHDPGVGGRYSALSVTGVLPSVIAGLDVVALREGAASVLDGALAARDPADVPAAIGAALAIAALRHHGATQTVLMPYCDRLATFGLWFRQLWAESLGKNGAGTTPIRAVGTVDQHSQLQLYLAGPRDKIYSLMLLDCANEGPVIDAALAKEIGYLAGRRLGALMDAEGRATAQTLMRNGRPTRLFRLAKLDERAMGALMMHFMLETILTAHLLGVDPFDQPAVEEGKVLTREYLAK
jgi:glucose-6-phosphate isomerase